MKSSRLFKLLVLALGTGAMALMVSCKGDDGATGPAGKDGVDGTDGTPGVAGNAVCMECHNIDRNTEVTTEYLSSVHGIGAQVGYAGGRQACAKCHSDQGFLETQYTGADTTASASGVPNPQPVQCQSCHDFHQSLDFENEPNYALRTVAPVDLLMFRDADPTAAPVTIDLGSGGNLCANCHQPRRVGPNAMDDSTRVTSSHYGPHHGPQSTSIAGLGAYEVGTGYPTPGTGGKHITDASCTTCHMHGQNHGFEPTLDGCNTAECHNGSMSTLSDNTRQMAFKTKMTTLEGKLKTAGLLDVDGHPAVGKYPTDQVGALYNYEWILDDRSNGLHNFGYLEVLLDNSIAVFP